MLCDRSQNRQTYRDAAAQYNFSVHGWLSALVSDDAHVIHPAHTLVSAVKGMWLGQAVSASEAMAAVTTKPAQLLQLANTGSLQSGIRADVAIWDGYPMDWNARVTQLLSAGKPLHPWTSVDPIVPPTNYTLVNLGTSVNATTTLSNVSMVVVNGTVQCLGSECVPIDTTFDLQHGWVIPACALLLVYHLVRESSTCRCTLPH
jgi:adenine deaminase